MESQIDKDGCRVAYEDVRDDNTDSNWAVFKYEGSTIVPAGQGTDYEEFKKLCTDDTRLYAYVRVTTGDAMSRRTKFTLITWIGENVPALKRAKISIDKAMVKEIMQNFAKEFLVMDQKELEEDYIIEELRKAGGANYDAQAE
ncbi:coactosin [Solea senegalensis]|uniref:Coactosin-like protein n=1 Tax=Solea senegalensis TaxID=28829 RepID=A0AAV6T0N4_SOLSE|nr:coactosin-like protein [Solea senegalensis]KAG7522917.1 coactosin [Solea senegalensis]